jgi:hypothetical protein
MPARGPGKTGNRIRDGRQAKPRKPRRVSVDIEDEAVALRIKRRNHAVEDAAAGDGAHRLVAATHSPAKAAREHDARCRRSAVWQGGAVHHEGQLSMTTGGDRYKPSSEAARVRGFGG